MKDKNIAGILALIFPFFGAHRFYLGDSGRGVFYLFLSMGLIGSSGIGIGFMYLIGFIDAMSLFTMSEEKFDKKYNKNYRRTDYEGRRRRNTDYDREEYRQRRRENRQDRADRRISERRGEPTRRRRTNTQPSATRSNRPRRSVPKANPFKQSGIKKFKDYEYAGAIADFEEALKIDPNDIAIHFNLTCAYSLTENADKAFYHLERAVALGFKDTEKIKTHEALAYLRIQDDFEAFEKNGYRRSGMKNEETTKPITTAQEDDLLSTKPDLLDQLKKLGELREKGLLTEIEFAEQKRKLLG